METPRDSQLLPQSEPIVEEENAVEEWHEQQEDEYNVHALKDLIIAKQEDPDPSLLHAIAAIFENAITRYMDDTDHGRSAQNVACLCGLIWGDEKFPVLLPSFLQNAYSVSVKVAAARLFSSCSTLMHRDILKDDALDKTRSWVRNEIPRLLADDCYPMHETGRRKDLDSEMMCTYYTGLLAANLARGDDQLKKEVLTYNLPAKLMLYLSDEMSIHAEDITDLVKQAGRASKSEAKATNAPALAVREAGDAAEVVKTAAFEEYRKTNYEEKYAELLRLAKLRFCIQCLVVMKKHVEVLDLLLCEDGFDIICVLLKKCSDDEKASSTILPLPDVLKLTRELVVNKKFAKLFVEGGGLERLLAIKRSDLTFVDLSFCLLRFGGTKIMESICALPSNVVDQFVELGIHLNCQQDQSRSNAALFFGYHHVFRPRVMDAFDKRYGQRNPKFLQLYI